MIKLWTVDPSAGAVGATCLRTLEGHTAAVLALEFVTQGTQLISTGGDGLLVLWGVRLGASVATLDAHDDKAWALACDGDGERVVTGGADAKLTLWRDATRAAAEEAAALSAKQTGAAQALSNAAASGHHEKAARLALKLNHPHALLKAINAMLADPEFGEAALDALAGSVKGKALHRLLNATREWNANARHCDAAQRVLASLLRLRFRWMSSPPSPAPPTSSRRSARTPSGTSRARGGCCGARTCWTSRSRAWARSWTTRRGCSSGSKAGATPRPGSETRGPPTGGRRAPDPRRALRAGGRPKTRGRATRDSSRVW